MARQRDTSHAGPFSLKALGFTVPLGLEADEAPRSVGVKKGSGSAHPEHISDSTGVTPQKD